jgi:nitrate reductase (NAD(P)H)
MMPKYHIGTLSLAALHSLKNTPEPGADSTTSSPDVPFLNPRAWSTATLVTKQSVSWDTRVFTFAMNHKTQPLGLPVGQHLMIKLKDAATNEVIIRPYTPLSSSETVGIIDVLVKIYFDSPETSTKGGKMTLALDAIRTTRLNSILEHMANGTQRRARG